jgi:hypothetical protein
VYEKWNIWVNVTRWQNLNLGDDHLEILKLLINEEECERNLPMNYP